jgi:protein transport protein SEC61 subunit gamma and related proteins
MNPKQTLKNMANTLKMAKKPDREEYQQHLRLVLIGIAGVGAMGFTIQFVFSVITFGR